MPSFIASCPSCGATLLEETVQCPDCDHVLDQGRFEQLSDQAAIFAQGEAARDQESCPACGEMVRHGLVRCWNCGSFMREEMAAVYQQMQSGPAPIIYSEPTSGEDPIYQFEETPVTTGHDEDDFELSSEVAGHLTDRERDFSTSPEFAPRPAAAPSPATSKADALSDTDSLTQPQPAAETPTTDSPSDARETATEGTAAELTTTAMSGEQPAEPQDGSEPAPESNPADEDHEAHSVATGGDVLLKVALEEELELERRRAHGGRRRRKGRAITGFVVFCPNGHRIEVHNRHRGKAGRCPKCSAAFIVPETTAPKGRAGGSSVEDAQSTDETGAGGPAEVVTAGAFTRWMTDVCFHTVDPQKLRLRPASLQKDFQAVDLGFSSAGLLVATLVKPGSLFGLGENKKDTVREGMLTALRQEKSVDDLKLPAQQFFETAALENLSVVQPVIDEHKSMFAGVPVFGEGRIAVRFPKIEASQFPQFASFFLSEFRLFSSVLQEFYDIPQFGADCEIPLTDQLSKLTCHYSEQTFQVLEHIGFYQRGPAFKLKRVGRKCEACGLVVSEDSRKKERIGGASGRGIARAKCPKCGKKFGDVSLYDLEERSVPTGFLERNADEA